MIGAGASVYVWFLCQINVNKSQTCTVPSAPVVTGSVLKRIFRLFVGTVQHILKKVIFQDIRSSLQRYLYVQYNTYIQRYRKYRDGTFERILREYVEFLSSRMCRAEDLTRKSEIPTRSKYMMPLKDFPRKRVVSEEQNV